MKIISPLFLLLALVYLCNPPDQESTSVERIADEDVPGLHNVLKLPRRIYSGSEPHGEQAFQTLAQKGIKVIVSVDGAKPNLELAKKYGLRYIHIPIGYDGVPDVAGRTLARLVGEVKEPMYIHCHHGQHRGPAAAAVACIAAGTMPAEKALAILKAAGTSSEYAGLWRDVKNYQPPKPGEPLPKLVETAKVDSLAAAMAKLDRHYDNLKLCQKAGWKTPKNHPDLVPAQEALLVREGLHESGRLLDKKYSGEFRQWLGECESLAMSVEEALRKDDAKLASQRFQLLVQSCRQCHLKYRN